LRGLKDRLAVRARVLQAIRAFFDRRGFIEVQTPVLVDSIAPEPFIEAFLVPQSRGNSFLAPSPELNMKRLLAKGLDKIYQLGPVFRRGEQGKRHLPEFTMLEWYRAYEDYRGLMADCEDLLRYVARATGHEDGRVSYQGTIVDLKGPFYRLTVKDAFSRFAGWVPGPNPDPDRFDEDLAFKVEPCLPRDRPTFLLDYPASCASLSRLKASCPDIAERVELYIGDLEIANGFSELVDPEEQERRFRKETKRRKRKGLPVYPMPADFLDSLKSMPPSAGMALGVDRLVMFFTDSDDIREVAVFPIPYEKFEAQS